jgi:serine/threonine protein kinase
MVTRAHAHAEPIPGYKLIERLGAGGFGEVWKAEAPGGLLKAIKFVHGTLSSAAEGDETAVQQELKSLNRVKTVRHPYILSLERYDIVDGQLMIVMELADKNLLDRFKECSTQGLPGIPRDELLRYMEEAAEALDLMNIQYGLQHLDIKPANLFLVHNHVKVADFGLVKDLEGMNAQVTGGVTPIYAAPETFDGVISRYCDQYNLAIVYQELLTGQRPFSGTNLRQLLMQHMTEAPDLKALPEEDQPTIGRSLSKKPEDRFPSCTEMVQALRRAGVGTVVVRKDSTAPPARSASLETPPLSPANTPAQAPPSPVAPAPARPRPAPPSMTPPSRNNVTATLPILDKKPPTGPVVIAEKRAAVLPPPREETSGEGILFPALIIGVGGLGLKVLKHVRKRLYGRGFSPHALPTVQLLYIETDPESAQRAFSGHPEGVLDETEIILARLDKPSHYLRPVRERSALDAWLNLNILSRLPRNQTTPDGLRLLGRLALVDNYRAITAKLKEDFEGSITPQALAAADKETKLGIRTSQPRVYIASSLGGGTGSGMFIDLAYVVRRQLRMLGVGDPEVHGMLLLPAAEQSARKNPALVNAFAALTELEHFSSPKVTYTASFDEGEEAYKDPSPPFQRCVVLPLPDEGDLGATDDQIAWAGDFISRELVTPFGLATDEARTHLSEPCDSGTTCQTFGAYVFSTPHRLLVTRLSRALAQRMLRGWLTADRSIVKTVRLKLGEQINNWELTPENLIASLQGACAACLEEDPETLFQNIVHNHIKPGEIPEPETVVETLQQLEEIVGQPQDDSHKAVTSAMVEALDEAARTLRQEWEQKLVDLVRGLLDDPKFRIVGGEEAALQITRMLEDVIDRQQPLLQELHTNAEEAYLTIDNLMTGMRKGSWWPGRKAKLAEELRQTLEKYPKYRYQCLVLESLMDVYQALLKKVPKRLAEVTFCRQRLTRWLDGLQERDETESKQVRLGPGRHFLPDDCRSFDEALEGLIERIDAKDLSGLDHDVQAVVRERFKSVADVCLADDDAFKDFTREIMRQAIARANEQIGGASAAALYLKQQEDEQQVSADLASAFESAVPVLPGRRYAAAEIRLVMVPDDEAGAQLAPLVHNECPEAEVVTVHDGGDVFFYRERPKIALADLPQLGLMVEEIYKQMTASGQFTPHTRTDITEWLPGN